MDFQTGIVGLSRAVAVLGSLAPSLAFAQDGAFDVELVGVPVDLEGHESAPRTRPAVVTPEPVEAPAERDWFGGRSVLQWDRLAGDWGGARTRLADAGLTFEASYIFEWSGVWKGGASGRGTRRTLLDVNITLDAGRAFGLDGGTLFFDASSTSKSGGSEEVGDAQGFSNIETDESVDQIAELWYEQVFGDGALRFKAGKIEANAEFAFVNAAGEFINSSAGFSPTVLGFPTYPDPATGVVAQAFLSERVSISVGVFDGAAGVDGVRTGTRGPSTFFSSDLSDDYFFVGELGLGWELPSARAGRVGLGVWRHTGKWATFDGGEKSGTSGVYALAEQRLWARDPNDSDSDAGLHVFAQFGWADRDVSEIELHAAAGLTLLGVFGSRGDDAAGVYVSWARMNERAGYDADETAIEFFYRLQLTPWISLKPDVQVILNPGGDGRAETAVVASLRAEIVF